MEFCEMQKITRDRLESLSEADLAGVAEQHFCDNTANKAMSVLRSKFDETYFWCLDCDGLVCKEAECCLNREHLPEDDEGLPLFF